MTDIQLTFEEARVLGALIEKQVTTPEYYPMSLNALVNACNQKNNRDPVTAFDDRTVVVAVDGLRDKRLVAMVTEAGARVPKYRHVFSETVGLDERDTAILCELLIRGPQTLGELRGRCERMVKWESPEQAEAVVNGLLETKKLVVKLPRQPGRKESRFAHVLCGMPDVSGAGEVALAEPVRAEVAGDIDRLARLENEVADLKRQFAEFKKQFE